MTRKSSFRYGAWPSPVSSSHITSDSVILDEITLTEDTAYWIEKRPVEKGRCVIVKYCNDHATDILPPRFSARSRVHEYGGGVYCVARSGLYFVNDTDQDIYVLNDKNEATSVTSTSSKSYADLQFDECFQRLICICQQQDSNSHEPLNSLIAINPSTGEHLTLHQGHDFYSSPRLSPCGTRICWLCWDHPDMPWDRTQLWTAELTDDRLVNPRPILPEATGRVSVFQPEWSPDNILYFISDETGWWNLYRYIDNSIEQLTNERQEFGRPQWVFSQSTYAFIDSRHLVCAPIANGTATLLLLDVESKTLGELKTEWCSIESLRSTSGSSWFIAASSDKFAEIIYLNHETREHKSVRSSCTIEIDSRYFSHGQAIEFKTRHNDIACAIYYPPVNYNVIPDAEDTPPLIVLSHGGPTAMSDASLDLRKQFWTTRGFAVVDVNYSGSTGFGRAYRQRLDANWGIRDVEDCCDAALHLVETGLADPRRLIIRGSSAGGYTVLCALAFHDVFAAGACYYGIGNLESLLDDTHKFESHYTDRLVGPYPEHRQRYHDRSPLNFADQLKCPVIFFQGAEDRVVPMEQTERMYIALRSRGVPVSCIIFPGEQHGFRQAATIQRSIDSEYAFYAGIFHLDAEDTIDLHIDNL